jgi:phosphatidylserine decarboxylase
MSQELVEQQPTSPLNALDTLKERLEAEPPVLGAVKEGFVYIVASLILTTLLNRLFPRLGKLFWLVPALLVFFFRDPPRTYPQDDAYLYAAADGTIVTVDRVEDDWFLDGPATRIVTFLSVLNVHVNRSPVAGEVAMTEGKPGTFANAMSLEKSESNERNLVGISGQRGPVLVVQIAGLLARRIVCWAKAGDQVRAGQKFGMIKFSSRTDVLVPLGSVEVLVTPGQQVRGGVTPIARYK